VFRQSGNDEIAEASWNDRLDVFLDALGELYLVLNLDALLVLHDNAVLADDRLDRHGLWRLRHHHVQFVASARPLRQRLLQIRRKRVLSECGNDGQVSALAMQSRNLKLQVRHSL